MFNHQPPDYNCPFCLVVAGGGDKYTTQDDIVYRDDLVTAFIAPRWWPNNAGIVLIIPNKHFENLYDIDELSLSGIYKVAKKLAIVMKEAYNCAGISTRQHNEPVGGQDVWHLHVQLIPRYNDDKLYLLDDQRRFVGADERQPFVEKLRKHLS